MRGLFGRDYAMIASLRRPLEASHFARSRLRKNLKFKNMLIAALFFALIITLRLVILTPILIDDIMHTERCCVDLYSIYDISSHNASILNQRNRATAILLASFEPIVNCLISS